MHLRTLSQVISKYMSSVPQAKEFSDRCLRSERWGGNVVLMVVDAAFTSTGLSYFRSVVPKVLVFEKAFIQSGVIRRLEDLCLVGMDELRSVWKNERSWAMVREIARTLISFDRDDREALRKWARGADIRRMRKDPIGRIKGMGPVTFQYLRMMGGIDTLMPDKIVMRVVNKILAEAGLQPIDGEVRFVVEVERLARASGHRPIDLCWMAWLLTSDRDASILKRYPHLANIL